MDRTNGLVNDVRPFCPACGSELILRKAQVMEHVGSAVVRRERHCASCDVTTTTYEVPQRILDMAFDSTSPLAGIPIGKSCGG